MIKLLFGAMMNWSQLSLTTQYLPEVEKHQLRSWLLEAHPVPKNI